MQITLQIDNYNSKGLAFLDYIRAIANNDNFLKIKDEIIEEENSLMKDIEQGLREVKLAKEGKIKLNTLQEFLDELD